MEQNQAQRGDLHELSSSYALGALDEAERLAFEDHLRGGCELCAAELCRLSAVSSELAQAAAAPPPDGLRGRLLRRIRHTSRKPGILFDQGGLFLSRSAEILWEPYAPGVVHKPLFTDTGRRYETSLVRMEAGARFPSHRHRDIEELFVLSGDLRVSGLVMGAGDYCRADTSTVHGETFSETGCLLLMMASQDNEMLV